jgi:hypothetical protein
MLIKNYTGGCTNAIDYLNFFNQINWFDYCLVDFGEET